MRTVQALLSSAAIVLASAADPAAGQEWKPQKNVDLVVSAGAGGAADRQARLLQRFLQSVPGMPSVTVANKPGGGGTIVWTYIAQHAGDPHYLATLTTGLLTNEITFWEQAFAKIVQDEDWKKDLERNSWSDDFRGSAETRRHLDSEYELLSKALVELGVISRWHHSDPGGAGPGETDVPGCRMD